ncbi:MAG: restriction endonuclease subunit S [Candidatus Pelagadaptatus aseana]|uniref:restriction endonuclease subunit S n=1 Tax=Candidatus Pelagadaptatus aseana TaxID=3120508 RepID=UPI0039B2F17E
MGWTTKGLADVLFIQEGPGIRKYEYEEDGYPMINVRCVQDGYIDMSKSRSANYELATGKWKHFQVEEGDILYTISGTIGRSAIVKKADLPLLMNTSVVRFRSLLDELDTKFVYYFFKTPSFINELLGHSTGTAIKNVGPSHLKKMCISYPALPEQKRIVAILDQAFADIDKARALTEQNLKNARELFESYLQQVFSQRGEGWSEERLQDVSIEFGRGKSKHRPRNDPVLYGGEYPFIQTGDVRNCEHLITSFSKTYNEAGLAQSKLWPKGTICITIAANIAETGILDFDGCFPDSVIGIVVDPKLTTISYVEYLLQSFKIILQAQGKGSAQDNINLGTFENMKFPFPSLDEQEKIVHQLSGLMTHVQELEKIYQMKIEQIDELKKSLLQKAFTGELTNNIDGAAA